MKKLILIILSSLTSLIYAQYYTVSDFLLEGNVKRVSVQCYDINEVEGEYIEALPYTTNSSYHTDLNLHYLEFNKEGELIRSKLYYPRDFYGQFSWLSPQFDLESSDYSEKINYLSAMHRYRYDKDDNGVSVTITSEDGTKVNVLVDNNRLLKEDEYYTYSTTKLEEKEVLTKKRKGSLYGFRRLETISLEDKKIVNEYINNRFLISKRVEREGDDFFESIYLSRSSINLLKIKKDGDRNIEKSYVNLSWRNKFLKWPEIDFNIDLDYQGFLNMLERESDEYLEEYSYDVNGNISTVIRYKYGYNSKKEILKIDYEYSDNMLKRVVINPDPIGGESDLFFKEYEYDSMGNWNIKVVGNLKRFKGELIRVPTKKYVKTLTYWN